MLSLGIDSGTMSTRALALDAESGKVLVVARREHAFLEGLPHGHVEQLPDTWVTAADSAVLECLAALGGKREAIRSIGVSAQQHGLVAVDSRNQPVRPA